MDLLDAMSQAAKGMKAQGARMKVISENVANADTTAKTPGADPYRRKIITFKNELNKVNRQQELVADKVVADKSDFVMKYEPGHPAADKQGFIKLPNVNPLIEMMDMREAQRSYEANIGVIDMSKGMLMRTIDLLNR